MRLSEVFKPMVQAIEEALKPSEYRQFVKGWDKNRWAELFGGKYRIYLPLEKTSVSVTLEDDYEELAKKLSSINIRLGAKVSEVDGKKVKTGGTVIRNVNGLISAFTKIVNVLYDKGYVIDDYLKGLAELETDSKRKVNIGKLLAPYPELKQFYDLDPVRQGNIAQDRQMVVISRHPYDISSMSTDRGWTSCMNLHSGSNRHHIPIEIQAGTIIAYLVDKKDTNINNASARLLIKPFISDDSSSQNDDSIVLGIQDKVYGTATDAFTDTVTKWVDGVNLSRKMDGVFTLHPGVYDDSGFDKTRYYKQGNPAQGHDFSELVYQKFLNDINDDDFEGLVKRTVQFGTEIPDYVINKFLPKILKMSLNLHDLMDMPELPYFFKFWNTSIDKFEDFEFTISIGGYEEVIPYFMYDVVECNGKNASKLAGCMHIARVSYGKRADMLKRITEYNPKWKQYF